MPNQSKQLTFTRGKPWVYLFLLATTVHVIVANVVRDAVDVAAVLPVGEPVVIHASSAFVSVCITLWFFRTESVSLARVGLSTGSLGPALGSVTAFYLVLNLIGGGLTVATGTASGLEYQWTVPPGEAITAFFAALVFAAVPEELAFRGYLQSKLIAILPKRSRFQPVIGILTASILFALVHIPRVLTDGVPGAQSIATYGLLLVVSGLSFGLLYEYTQNLWIPILIHAAGNMPGTMGIVFFDTSAFHGIILGVYILLFLAVTVLLVGSYRRLAFTSSELRAWVDRDDRASSRV